MGPDDFDYGVHKLGRMIQDAMINVSPDKDVLHLLTETLEGINRQMERIVERLDEMNAISRKASKLD